MKMIDVLYIKAQVTIKFTNVKKRINEEHRKFNSYYCHTIILLTNEMISTLKKTIIIIQIYYYYKIQKIYKT